MAPADVLRGPGEVAEDEATGAVAEAYAHLRAALGVEFLPTVVRMLGRYDRLLAAATDSIADLMGGPEGERFAAGARRRAAAAAARLPGGDLPAGPAAGGIAALLERYNTANPRNLLLVLALAGGSVGGPAGGAGAAGVLGAPASAAGAAARAVEPELLDDIRAWHGGFTVPGLWRELAAGWPDVAAGAWALVRPLAHEAELRAAVEDLLDAGRTVVAGRAIPSPAELGYGPEEQTEIARICGWFAGAIPTMVVEIEYLRDRLRDV